MNVSNIHERELNADSSEVGELLDSIASKKDGLWPRRTWPPMILDRPLRVGAAGGHAEIRYIVEEYIPGESILFRFTAPKGFVGYHRFEVVDAGKGIVILRHTLKMKVKGWALLSWPVIYRPLHDALVEDSLSVAEASIGQTPEIVKWSLWVRFLRWVLS